MLFLLEPQPVVVLDVVGPKCLRAQPSLDGPAKLEVMLQPFGERHIRQRQVEAPEQFLERAQALQFGRAVEPIAGSPTAPA